MPATGAPDSAWPNPPASPPHAPDHRLHEGIHAYGPYLLRFGHVPAQGPLLRAIAPASDPQVAITLGNPSSARARSAVAQGPLVASTAASTTVPALVPLPKDSGPRAARGAPTATAGTAGTATGRFPASSATTRFGTRRNLGTPFAGVFQCARTSLRARPALANPRNPGRPVCVLPAVPVELARYTPRALGGRAHGTAQQ